MAFETAVQKQYRDVKLSVWAAMETGNHPAAETALREYAAIDLDCQKRAKTIHSDVISSYGIALRM